MRMNANVRLHTDDPRELELLAEGIRLASLRRGMSPQAMADRIYGAEPRYADLYPDPGRAVAEVQTEAITMKAERDGAFAARDAANQELDEVHMLLREKDDEISSLRDARNALIIERDALELAAKKRRKR